MRKGLHAPELDHTKVFGLETFSLKRSLRLGTKSNLSISETKDRFHRFLVTRDLYFPDASLQKLKQNHRIGSTRSVEVRGLPLELGAREFVKESKWAQQIRWAPEEPSAKGKIRKKRVRWNVSRSPDVVGYKLYWAVGRGVNYESDCADLGLRGDVILPEDIPSFPRVAGHVELGVTAVSQAGNESEITKLSVFFDFTAPDPPTGIEAQDI